MSDEREDGLAPDAWDIVDTIAALRARLADNERWAQEFKARFEQVKQERDRLKDGHCKDCCCARSWMALGGQSGAGSIVEHIDALRDRLRTLEERAREVVEELRLCEDSTDEEYIDVQAGKLRRLADALGEK